MFLVTFVLSLQLWAEPIDSLLEKKVVKWPTFKGLNFCANSAADTARFICESHGYQMAEVVSVTPAQFGDCYGSVRGVDTKAVSLEVISYQLTPHIDEIHCYKPK